jgi:integron integrase
MDTYTRHPFRLQSRRGDSAPFFPVGQAPNAERFAPAGRQRRPRIAARGLDRENPGYRACGICGTGAQLLFPRGPGRKQGFRDRGEVETIKPTVTITYNDTWCRDDLAYHLPSSRRRWIVRELETTLQQFGEFLLRARLVNEKAAPHCVRWVRRFLARPASTEPLADQVRQFAEELEHSGRWQDWQLRQAQHALQIYFVNFLRRTDWRRQTETVVSSEDQAANPLTAFDELRRRLRTRHYSYRTECSYIDWAKRFFAYLSERQGVPRPRVEPDGVQDYLTHLAVRRRVSASTQNQACCALLFLCREVLRIDLDGLSDIARAKRGSHLPVVLSIPETAALLGAMRGTTWLMAALIYGGGLRVSECCELRIKDLDFDQALIVIRSGKGMKDRSTLLGETCQERLRAQLQKAEAIYRADRNAGLAGVWLSDALERKYPTAGCELGWFCVFPRRTLSTDPRAGIVRRHHLHESVVQKAVKTAAVEARIHKPVSVHTVVVAEGKAANERQQIRNVWASPCSPAMAGGTPGLRPRLRRGFGEARPA